LPALADPTPTGGAASPRSPFVGDLGQSDGKFFRISRINESMQLWQNEIAS